MIGLVLVLQGAYGQQLVPHSMEQLLPIHVSPNIVLDTMSVGAVTDLDMFSVQANFPIESNYDSYNLGVGYLNKEFYDGVNMHLGCVKGRIRMSLIVGYYKTPSRKATYGGASLSFHHSSGYLGVTVNDVFDVSMEDGTEEDFYNFEAMTPQLFAKQQLLTGDIGLNIYGNVSYHDIEEVNYRSALEVKYSGVTVGGGYSKFHKWMGYTELKLGNFNFLGSYDGDFYIGLRYQ